jgi:ketosteroid isomerase-like protein
MSAPGSNSGVELVNKFVADWLRGDLDAVMAYVADDVVFTPAGYGGTAITYRGRDEVRAAFAEQVGDDPALTFATPVGTADRVLGEWTYQPAADGTVLRGVDVYTFQDGLIVAKDVYSKLCTVS